MTKIWIALSGKAGCGKSTIADALVEHYGFERHSFAKRLKEICEELFPELTKQDKNSYRWALQKFGDDTRKIKTDVWIDIVLNDIEQAQPRYKERVVIDDVRYLNEFLKLQRNGFKLIRIERNDELRAKFGYNVKDRHPSECQLDDLKVSWWDLVVHNDFKYPFVEAVEYIANHFKIESRQMKLETLLEDIHPAAINKMVREKCDI